MYRRICLVAVAAIWTAGIGSSETIELKDGRKVSGSIQSADSREIKIQTASGVETVSVANVQSISMSDGGEVSAAPAPTGAPASEPQTQSGDLPAGITISIRTIDVIDSQGADLNRDYSASLAEPVVVNRHTLVPVGADAVLRVVEAKQAGRFTGRASLTLKLMAVVVNGQRINVQTASATSSSPSQGMKTIKDVAVGTGFGTLAGVLLGGGKGAAIGAAAGAASGATVASLSGQRVKVPTETRLTFVLSQPASVY